ncbi:recombinase [Psychrobium sp. 1_MG-2023]|uniref:recombinase n=1 Tax=Psychrobium sp. 1_MG-2023 TaxID=3062624 RepID=UPI000C31CD41|nr:recombinase [Psychrobium sp. 1_MG-2023]MDP2561198.1 hypothetical protein [Psychrobium sp. 1_MG-2023]PKF55295.1 recombinase [Alteromonadales bacterium alter-6D02]
MKSTQKKPSKAEYDDAISKWESFEPPYSSSHIKSCVTAAKTILAFTGKPNISKYEITNHLRIVFNKKGEATFRTHFGNKTGIKTSKLGVYPELQPRVARDIATSMWKGDVSLKTVHHAIDLFEEDRKRRNKNGKLKDSTIKTYLSRTKKLRYYFREKDVFANVKIIDVENVLDNIIASETGNYANELSDEIKRLWKFAASKLADGNNVTSKIAVDYVSSRVNRSKATKLYTDLDSIAQLYSNVAAATSLHQVNAVRFMVLTGVRPINVHNLRWDWLDCETYPTKITFPDYAMKANREFILPVTDEVRKILNLQRDWRNNVGVNCNQQHVFLKPRNLKDAFSVRSLDKLIKDFSPVDCVRGALNEQSIKGRNGAFNTMCRKFAKSNIKGLLVTKANKTLGESTYISKLVLHHACGKSQDGLNDDMAEHYDFSDELFNVEFDVKLEGLRLHEESILTKVNALTHSQLRPTGLGKKKELRERENSAKDELRRYIRSRLGKRGYTSFINSYILDISTPVNKLILNGEGRKLIHSYLNNAQAA